MASFQEADFTHSDRKTQLARPKKSYYQRRIRQVNFRVTEAEYDLLRNYCSENNTSITDLVLIGINKHYRPSQSKIDQNLIIQLSRVGNNLNQIARSLNQAKRLISSESDQLKFLQKDLVEIRKLLGEIRGKIL